MNQTDNKKSQNKQKWTFVFFLLNSSILLQGGKVIAERYFNNDRLPLSYFFLIGIITSILAWVIEYLTKNWSQKMKIILAVLITILVAIIAVFVPKNTI